MADCLISPVKQIWAQCVWPFLKPHVHYWWFFDDNIQDLRERIEELMQRKRNIEEQRKLLVLHTDNLLPLDNWLKASTDKLEEARQILLPNANIPHASNLFSRYSLGKNAKKIAEEIAKLINKGEFNNTADPAPQPAMKYPFHGSILDFESRKSIEKDIIDSLNKSSVDMIGICGMGGVGKTSMARRIEKRVEEKKLFDEVVWVTVSQTMNLHKIQNEIADSLKLKFDESNRAKQLRTKLMDAKRKIIIFDDVWESLNFEELGFPIEGNFEKCKVLLTSRDRGTCNTIKNKVVFDLKNLGAEEAWNLFKDKAGKCVEDLDLEPVAREVAAECQGLPIALVTVGIALKDEKNIRRWNSSLLELKQGNPSDLTQVLEVVYKPLKLSYNCLEKEWKRNLFLMCCLFPEDYNIPIEQLTWYRMFGDNTIIEEPNIINIEDARNQTNAWVEELKRRSLLIDGKDKLHVKMHDLVRDMAIYVGSKQSNGFLKSLHRSPKEDLSDAYCNWMSVDISNGQMEVPMLSRFPNLRLLMLSSNLSSDQFYNIPFKGIENLKVLSFQNISIRSLPSTLANLQTLRLFRCGVENISFIGKLTKLKILSCCKCENITELPKEIGSLKDLKLLELYRCPRLRTIPSGVISSLSLLEELKILSSFSKWETGGEGGNASLTELERLRNLTCLEIEISNCTLSAQEISLSKELVRYRISIGDQRDYRFESTDHKKVMKLNLPGAVGNWIQKLARKAEYLRLSADGSGNINLAGMEKLRDLKFTDCSTVKKLVDINQNVEYLLIKNCAAMEQVFCNDVRVNTYGCIEFPKLEQLILWNLPKLNSIFPLNIKVKLEQLILRNLPKLNSIFPLNIKDDSFSNLKSIDIRRCHNLRSVFSVRSSCLLQLEYLEIEDCQAMEQVFWNEGTNDCIEFPKLKELRLWNLPNLTAFCGGLENIIIRFPNLTKMFIQLLPKLNSFHLFYNIKDDSFSNLKSIHIRGCHNLRSVFSARSSCLLQLEDLQIEDCEAMEQVFWNEGTNECIDQFPKLKKLTLENLPKLNSLFPLNSKDISLLEILYIQECDSVEQVFWNEIKAHNTDGCIEFPNFKELTLKNLPNFAAFCKGLENIIIKFPNLTNLTVKSLSHLNSETVVSHDHNTPFHLFCNPKVKVGLLENLTLTTFEDNIKNIWCSQIPNNFFNNLKRLDINYMNGIRSLMSTSIAKNLVSLECLDISNCEGMVEVIEIDDDNDKQVVDVNPLFSNLKSLYFEDMPKLRWFWQWNHALELPLLYFVRMGNCPVIETFTLGSVNTERHILVNYKSLVNSKDLNDFIRNNNFTPPIL